MNMLIVKSIWALRKTDGLAKKRKHAAGKGSFCCRVRIFDAVNLSRSRENLQKQPRSLVWKTRPPSKQGIRLWGLNDVYVVQFKRLCPTRGSSRL